MHSLPPAAGFRAAGLFGASPMLMLAAAAWFHGRYDRSGFLLFCHSGETRKLSLLFPGLIVCAAATVQRVVSFDAIPSVRLDVHG